jgi:hypothetical protein
MAITTGFLAEARSSLFLHERPSKSKPALTITLSKNREGEGMSTGRK